MVFGALAIETVFHSFTQSLISNSEIGSHIVSYSFFPYILVRYSLRILPDSKTGLDVISSHRLMLMALDKIIEERTEKVHDSFLEKLLGLQRCTVNFTVATELGIDSRRWQLRD
jgi:hypothetical protein